MLKEEKVLNLRESERSWGGKREGEIDVISISKHKTYYIKMNFFCLTETLYLLTNISFHNNLWSPRLQYLRLYDQLFNMPSESRLQRTCLCTGLLRLSSLLGSGLSSS